MKNCVKNCRKKKNNELKRSFDVFSLLTMYFIFALFVILIYMYSDDIAIFFHDILERQIYLNY